jgi:hypothetical protein
MLGFLFNLINNTPMKKTTKTKPLSSYNQAVKTAYFKIVKAAKTLLSTIERHELRCTLIRKGQSGENTLNTTIHQLVNPIIYLSLECHDRENYSIHFGIEQFQHECEYSMLTAKFLRIIYKLTSVEQTTVNIDDCVNTAYVITDCSALYEAVEESTLKNHSLEIVPYKQTMSKRKQMKAVA